MTEAEWNACTDPQPMLEFLRGKASDRKLRLFACACCRRIWHLLDDERSRKAVEVAERFADRLVTLNCLQEASRAAIESSWALGDKYGGHWPGQVGYAKLHAAMAAEMCPSCETSGCVWGTSGEHGSWNAAFEAARNPDDDAAASEEKVYQRDIFRDIIGNPFRPIAADTGGLAWNNGTVVKLVQAIYHDRAFDRMPILADALEDAGCHDPDILAHCRGPGPHVRGCWVVDLLTGRE